MIRIITAVFLIVHCALLKNPIYASEAYDELSLASPRPLSIVACTLNTPQHDPSLSLDEYKLNKPLDKAEAELRLNKLNQASQKIAQTIMTLHKMKAQAILNFNKHAYVKDVGEAAQTFDGLLQRVLMLHFPISLKDILEDTSASHSTIQNLRNDKTEATTASQDTLGLSRLTIYTPAAAEAAFVQVYLAIETAAKILDDIDAEQKHLKGMIDAYAVKNAPATSSSASGQISPIPSED